MRRGGVFSLLLLALLSTHPLIVTRTAGAEPRSGETSSTPVDRIPPSHLHPQQKWKLSLGVETATGVSSKFRNHMLGARLAHQFEPRWSFGGYLGLVSLKGKAGRVGNLLPYAFLEYRVPLDSRGRWGVPLRFGSGYLPQNGPFLRLGPALAIPIGETTDLVLDVLVPTLWITQNRPEYSLNFSAEVLFRL